jgi:hypothetical protein
MLKTSDHQPLRKFINAICTQKLECTSFQFLMEANLVHFVRGVVHSDNTTYIVIVLSLAKCVNRCVVAVSSCRPVFSKARQVAHCCTARCCPVVHLISQSFDLSRGTMWHRDNMLHKTGCLACIISNRTTRKKSLTKHCR